MIFISERCILEVLITVFLLPPKHFDGTRVQSWQNDHIEIFGKKNQRLLRWFFFLLMINSHETNRKISMRLLDGIMAGRKSSKHAKNMILGSNLVGTFFY